MSVQSLGPFRKCLAVLIREGRPTKFEPTLQPIIACGKSAPGMLISPSGSGKGSKSSRQLGFRIVFARFGEKKVGVIRIADPVAEHGASVMDKS